MSAEMFKQEEVKGVTVLLLTLGNFFHDDNEALMKVFEQVLNEGHKKIVLDLAETNYISSLILASMVYMQKRSQENGGNLIFCNIKVKVKEIMAMTNLDKVFNIVATRDEAIASFKA